MSQVAVDRKPEQQERFPYKWKVLLSVIWGVFMVILDTTVVNIAFPTLRQEFGASISDSQWIISVYVLALGIGTPLAGYLADRFGIKRLYILALATFVCGSFLSGISPVLGVLIAARALQGFGGGVALPLGTALLFSAFPVAEQGFALGIFGIAILVAPALGPILGGFLVDHNLWRWIFFINLPVGITGIVLASRFLRRQPSRRRPQLHPLSLITMVIGFGAFLYAASVAANQGWTAPDVVLGFGIGIAGLVAFAVVELGVARYPLLDLRLYARRNFLIANLVGYIAVLALFGAEFLLPIYLQVLRGRTALQTGLILLPLAVTAAIATPLAGRLYDKIGPRLLVVVGFIVLVINTWQLSQLRADTPMSWILFLMALRGIALGMTTQTTFVTALSAVPLDELARGSSLVNATRFLVQSIGVAVLATVLASTLSTQAQSMQQVQGAPVASGGQPVGLCEVVESVPGLASAAAIVSPSGMARQTGQGLDPRTVHRICIEYLAGFDLAYQVTFYLAGLAVLVGALLPGWPFKWTGRGQGGPVVVAH